MVRASEPTVAIAGFEIRTWALILEKAGEDRHGVRDRAECGHSLVSSRSIARVDLSARRAVPRGESVLLQFICLPAIVDGEQPDRSPSTPSRCSSETA